MRGGSPRDGRTGLTANGREDVVVTRAVTATEGLFGERVLLTLGAEG
jgi:hypothetical protein